MAYNDPRGSLWNKWDLHVHTPGTKKNDQYKLKGGGEWDLFCKMLHESDVMAVGICDYFSAENYLTFAKHYNEEYPGSCKLFMPNIEVCTSYVVNKANEEVHVHLLFNPAIPNLEEKLDEFLRNLKTSKTDKNDRHISASELSTTKGYEEATTTLDYIGDAFRNTFGKKAEIDDYMLIITAANNDGIRTETEEKNGKKKPKSRKAVITDELDKFTHAFFGNVSNIEYFEDEDRLESNEKIAPKAVFSGSDAHSFSDLENYLGRQHVDKEGVIVKQATWVKAELTFDGVKQVLYEPLHGERYRLGTVRPDKKSPDRVIRRIKFADTSDFPEKVLFNDNLSAIIGSRSSGKSALLAYLAYAVDPEDAMDRKEDGPAAAISWGDVNLTVDVEWGDQLSQQGKVVYIPQNFLYKMSQNPNEITRMIKPVLFEKYPEMQRAYENVVNDIRDSFNKSISVNVQNWFNAMDSVSTLLDEIRDMGDNEAIEKVIDGLDADIEELKEKAALSDEDVKAYKDLSEEINAKSMEVRALDQDIAKIDGFLADDDVSGEQLVIEFTADITFDPSIENLPFDLLQKIRETSSAWSEQAVRELQKLILSAYDELTKEQESVQELIATLQRDNADLISRCRQNEELQSLIEQLDTQKERQAEIKALEGRVQKEKDQIDKSLVQLKRSLESRTKLIADLQTKFGQLDQESEAIHFRLEVEFNPKEYESLSARFNRKERSDFIEDGQRLKIESVLANPEEFLKALYNRQQKVLYDQDVNDCAADAFLFVEEMRFSAEMENDTIGGFQTSSMTEGKQALFALTLLLSKDSDTWPLLIDQPEDDLDSRSIYDMIVPFLKTQKKVRQIIMVSHNANLVIGSDSEQVIVANQHGEDRKNTGARQLDYISGALEYSKHRDDKCPTILQSRGIREHACDILDGGESAFQKRKNKYNL